MDPPVRNIGRKTPWDQKKDESEETESQWHGTELLESYHAWRMGGGGGGGDTCIPAKPNMLPEVYHASSQHYNLLGR
jgi:hypothetical protein